MTFVYLLIGFLCVYLFLNKQYAYFLIGYMALMTNFFMLFPISSGFRGSDVSLLVTIVLLLFNTRTNNQINNNGDKIRKYVIILIVFSFLELFYTILSGAENYDWALKVFRVPLSLLTFFIIRLIPVRELRRFVKYAFVITIIDGVLFLLEYVGIDTLPDVNPDKGLSLLGFANDCHTPILSFIFLFCCLSSQIVKKNREFLLIFFLSILLLTFVRSYLIAFIACAFLYLIIQKNDKSLILKFFVVAIVLYPTMSYVFNLKEKAAGADSSNDMQNILSGKFLDPSSNIHSANGTFAFRMSMLAERVQYLFDNPQYIIQGVGLIHEDSPNCTHRFFFILGTPNRDRVNGICIIESGDNTWIPIVLRYGLLGTFLYMYFFVLVYKNTHKRRDEYVILAPITVFYFLISFSGPFFDRADYYFIICLVLGLLYRLEYERCYPEKRQKLIVQQSNEGISSGDLCKH